MKRPWLVPLVPLYSAAVTLNHALYRAGWRRVRRLPVPVVSVGSLSAGGAGKTPVVLMLAELLSRHRIAADVLTRGYGRGPGVIDEVHPEGTAQGFGDEPLELTRAGQGFGLRVFVGADRFTAGQLAETAGSPAFHLLDDGFQHRRLARALDVVLLTREDVYDCLLPAGNLREPLSALRRADVVVLREEEADALQPIVRRHSKAQTWLIRRELLLPSGFPTRPAAFCAIARPANFLAMLRAAGIDPAGTVAMPDHHAWSREDIQMLADTALHSGADGFITTAKDAVKIPPAWQDLLARIGPFAVAQLRVHLVNEDQAINCLGELLRLRP